MDSIKAIVLAAGKGTRLHSAEHNQPKALREAAGKIDHLVPHVRLMEQPPHESRDTASVALEFPTPLVVLNSTIRQALSFLFSTCDTVQTDKTERGICFTFTVSKMWITEDAE